MTCLCLMLFTIGCTDVASISVAMDDLLTTGEVPLSDVQHPPNRNDAPESRSTPTGFDAGPRTVEDIMVDIWDEDMVAPHDLMNQTDDLETEWSDAPGPPSEVVIAPDASTEDAIEFVDVPLDPDASVDATLTETQADQSAMDEDVGPEPFVFQITIGAEDAESGLFTPLVDGTSLEIVQGPQGGIHLEILLRFQLPGALPPLSTGVHAHTLIDGVKVGQVDIPQYPTNGTDGIFETGIIPVFFFENKAEAYLGDPPTPPSATVCSEISLEDGFSDAGCFDVVLVDEQ